MFTIIQGLANAAQAQDPDTAAELKQSSDSFRDSIGRAMPRIGVAVLIIGVAWLLSRVLRAILQRAMTGRRTPSFATVMSKLAGWTLLVMGVLAAVAVTFPSVKPVDLLAGLGFFSVAIGFAFQDILENTLAGVLLLFRQPFETGDQIEVQDQTGTVEAITIRETRIKTFDGVLVLVPNRDVYKSVLRVQTHYEARRISFVVGIAYENDAEEACRVMCDALAAVDGVQSAPEPEALVVELGVSTVDIDARFWTASRQHDVRVVQDRAIRAVKSALDAAGVEMPADIVALQATPSFRAALQDDGDITPGGAVTSR